MVGDFESIEIVCVFFFRVSPRTEGFLLHEHRAAEAARETSYRDAHREIIPERK